MLSRTAQALHSRAGQLLRADLQLAVRPDELAEFDGHEEAKHLRRLEADQELMLQLNAEGFHGSTWRDLSTALAQYGFAVMRAWISSGLIQQKCRSRGLHLAPSKRPLTFHNVVDLTEDVVADSLIAFRDRVLATAVWNPARGASLATFFIGMCLNMFPNVRRSWERQERRWGTPVSLDLLAQEPRSAHSAEATALEVINAAEAFQTMLNVVSGRTNRAILKLKLEGYSMEEICELTGLSYKQVESRLYRIRSSLKSTRRRHDPDGS